MKSDSPCDNIKVIGSGVSGLTTALTLLENGYNVSIITREHFKDTVSSKAAAIWFPYAAEPVKKVNTWSKQSFSTFKELSLNPESGVSFIPFKIIEPQNTTPHWIDALPRSIKLSKEAIDVEGVELTSYSANIPLIETQKYLPYLHNQFITKGGSIEYREVHELAKLADKNLVINCTGLSSRELTNDTKLYPIQGQTIKIKLSNQIAAQALDQFPSEPENELAYIIPRSDCVILGGSAYTNIETNIIDADLNNRILKRCLYLEPKLKTEHIISTEIGLRPGRNKIRLEQDSQFSIIHNYGHGGAGFTVSWGCAMEVLNLVDNYFEK